MKSLNVTVFKKLFKRLLPNRWQVKIDVFGIAARAEMRKLSKVYKDLGLIPTSRKDGRGK